MTTERTTELEGVNQTIREILDAHHCCIKATKDLKAVVIADNEKPHEDYVFASGLVKLI